jgi:outer membrane lipoprotein-sorting protein
MGRWLQCSAVLAALLLWLPAATIAAPQPAALTPQDKAQLQQIAGYLNNIHTLSGRFQQAAGNGTSTGRVWIRRPGRMRFEYDPPNPVSLFADGFYIYYVDRDLNQVSRIGLKSTPAWFLLRDAISFDDVIVTGIERGPNTIRVSMVENAQPDAGSLTMTFTENPLALRQWTVVDQEGKTTTVSLSDLQFGIPLDPNIFLFQGPSGSPSER